MHHWGDKDVDFEGIGNAAYEIGEFCRKWGRFGGDTKEKYGTVRFYASMCYRTPFSVLYPGHASYRGRIPDWLATVDIYCGVQIMKYTGLDLFFSWWQPKVYNWAYQRALRKYPHLRNEILDCADYKELIKGCFRQDGNKLHTLGINGEVIGTWEIYE